MEHVAGTIRVGWSISERDLKIAHIERELTPAELKALYERIEELVTSAFHQRVSVWIDGEDAPHVDIWLEANGDEIEIDEPVSGLLPDLRAKLVCPQCGDAAIEGADDRGQLYCSEGCAREANGIDEEGNKIETNGEESNA